MQGIQFLSNRRNSANSTPLHGGACQGPIVLWSLRILADFVASRVLARVIDGLNVETLESLGLTAPDSQARASKLRARIRTLLTKQRGYPQKLTEPLATNLAQMGHTLGLKPLEQQILAFIVLSRANPTLIDVTENLGEDLDGARVASLLAAALDDSVLDVSRALRRDGVLASSGLLRLDKNGIYPLQHKFDLLGGLPDSLLTTIASPMELLERFFKKADAQTLRQEDFPHLVKDLALLEQYLGSASAQGTRGVNILIHGVPGTGKTELARLLAHLTGRTLYEIGMTDEEGEPIARQNRFCAYQLSQTVLSRRRDSLVLFDEIEDVFPSVYMNISDFGRDKARKAWINRILETNPVPAIWVCNAIDAIEPAHLRRFDYILEMRVPPLSVRRQILDHHFEKLSVREPFLQHIAEHPGLTPAQVERATRVVARLGETEPHRTEALLERVIGNSLEALGQPRRTPVHAINVCSYDSAFVNTDHNIDRITTGIAHHPQARLCLYGPPGTGKTAYVHHLADNLDRPLIVKRTSDLLSKWVGETEHRIAAMFRDAETEQAVLFLDEADSLLRERNGASMSWEVTQVNELLVQMETYEGIFVAATNHAEVLDAASLRRFDLKVRFSYLDSVQILALFQRVLAEHGQKTTIDAANRHRLAALDNLVPGDFATVVRKAHVLGEMLDAEQLCDQLIQESQVKFEFGGRSIGFTAVI